MRWEILGGLIQPDKGEDEAPLIGWVEEPGHGADLLPDHCGWCIEGLLVEVIYNLLPWGSGQFFSAFPFVISPCGQGAGN
jgi:hypothetical protein